eukprot:scaffold2647_cov21-Cyclotella_meneghiniana.AAC.2
MEPNKIGSLCKNEETNKKHHLNRTSPLHYDDRNDWIRIISQPNQNRITTMQMYYNYYIIIMKIIDLIITITMAYYFSVPVQILIGVATQ